MKNEEINKVLLPNLVGSRFVKNFTAYLMDAVRNERLTTEELVSKAYREKSVKSRTTKRYIKDLLDCNLLTISEDDYLSKGVTE